MAPWKTWAAALLLVLVVPLSGRAANVPPIERAKSLIRAGDLADASKLLAVQDPLNPEVLFLKGQIAGAERQWRAAEAQYRALLELTADAPRVRLELARALFEQGKDIAAEYQFRQALAEAPETEATVSDFLERIRQRKTWSGDLFAGGIADSDMNHATSAGEVTLFGLPFLLSQQARQKSGFGVNLGLSGEYSAALADQLRFRTGADFYRIDYQGGAFDDMQIAPYLGPHVFRSWGDFSVLAVALQRWYGNATYYYGYGARFEIGWNLSGASRLDTTIQAAQLWYPNREFLNGYQLDSVFALTYAFAPASYVRPFLGAGHQETVDKSWQNDYGRLGLGYGANLWWGVSLYLEPSAVYYAYASPSFGTDRRDWLVSATLTLSRRKWAVFGLIPSLTLGYQRDISTIDLFSYDRRYVLIGLGRHF